MGVPASRRPGARPERREVGLDTGGHRRLPAEVRHRDGQWRHRFGDIGRSSPQRRNRTTVRRLLAPITRETVSAVSSAARTTSLAARAGDSSREVAEPNGSIPRTPSATTATTASVAAATPGRQGRAEPLLERRRGPPVDGNRDHQEQQDEHKHHARHVEPERGHGPRRTLPPN